MGHNLSAIKPVQSGPSFTPLAISFSNTGDNTVVAAVAGKSVRVFRIFFVCSAATNVTIKDGAGTNLTGAMSMGANGGFTLDYMDGSEPWFFTSSGNAFIINQSGTAQISGTVFYQQ